jgi:hypothetical protein
VDIVTEGFDAGVRYARRVPRDTIGQSFSSLGIALSLPFRN